MRTETGEALERLVREHRAKVTEIRSDDSLSWEKQEKAIKALGDEYHARRHELERRDR
jgi:hypothetical protein